VASRFCEVKMRVVLFCLSCLISQQFSLFARGGVVQRKMFRHLKQRQRGHLRDETTWRRNIEDDMIEKRYARDDTIEKIFSRDDIKDELSKLARSQSDIISEIIHSRTGDNRVFSGPPSQNACRDWWFVIAPACFFIEGLGHDPSSSYPCCGLDGKGAI